MIQAVIACFVAGYLTRDLCVRNRLAFYGGLAACVGGIFFAIYNADRTTAYCGFTVPADLRGVETVHTAAQCALGHAGEYWGVILALAGLVFALRLIRSRPTLPPARESIPAWLRIAVWRRDEGFCQGCYARGTADDPLEIDHYVPVSQGGKTELSNLRLLHRSENRAKGARMPL
jgi:hypothetical protein